MTPQDFVNQVRASIIDENVATYRTLLETTPIKSASDPYWRSLIGLNERLSEGERKILYDVMRQVAVDAVSSLFAVIDGSVRMDGQTEDVELVGAKSRQRLNGSLQDLLLQLEERDSAKR
ncbi:hypothetical protein [Archangium lipolyticum]|uniref:hypothetical protein n=1 Tax=Archangium lipolyticum TaxID=2970465 RepID=UPI002149EE05|nr:hypothetical protein [Archangium lipolyticum]